MGADYPFTKDFILSLTLRGVARSALHTPSRAPPVTPGILLQLFRSSSSQEPISCTLFCAFLFAFFLMARLANIVPESQAKFDPKRHLTRGDVVADAHGLIVTFKATKTIQFGERKLRIPLIRIPGSPLCPVRAYRRMVRLMPAPAKSALFLLPQQRGVQLLTKRRLISEFRRSLQAAGVPNAQGFRGHSFRRGAASWAFNQGVPGELIQLYGDWSSDAYKLYLEFRHDAKLVLAHRFRQAILSLWCFASYSPCTPLVSVWRWFGGREVYFPRSWFVFRISPNKPLPYAKLRSERCAVVSVVWVAGLMGELVDLWAGTWSKALIASRARWDLVSVLSPLW